MQYGFVKTRSVKRVLVGTYILISERSVFSNIILTLATEHIVTKPMINRNVSNLIRGGADFYYRLHPEPSVLFVKHFSSSIYHKS